jgi:hypothetical protein
MSRRGPASGKFIVSHESMFVTLTVVLLHLVTGALHPTGIEGANQTIFVRRIALRPPISYFGRPRFNYSIPPTPFQRFCETVASITQNWWMIEKPKDTQSLPAAALGSSGLAGVEEESDSESEGNYHETMMIDEE